MTPRNPHDPSELTDTGKELLAIVEKRAEEIAEETAQAAVKKAHEKQAGEEPMQPNPTPPLGVLWGKGEEASHMRACEAPDGPIGKLRAELKEQHEQRDKSMRTTLVIVGLLLSAVTGGIQVWGRLSERSAAAGELTTAIHQVQAELAALKNMSPQHNKGTP